ncbi:GMC family oxidoreductase N-terminal domain-containing protein [Halostagnicola sp. A-GB9-2]|uniref:GMC family oxidoreductase n=1 Tax=Halostagnicola sp. A-GB9-2 TaxID=3048066 RepID=UPI0024BFBD8B|nr:GMC family oxidoreductase N-terminal domain-containing protein [Halostagnicola sp. A-GB9-2]MDJ1434407.1 GMC family oxidoreductase N-terminal domain-containing protein [Halostagnicola sp. A-GB9-2]
MSTMYDYVIVGGGSAGCVLTRRLTESEDTEVLLLEAGEPAEDRDMVKDPTRVWDVLGSELDWKFDTEPQPGMNGRTIDWPRGKALGGSSVINGMAYVRGHPYDYDNWAEMGNDGWSYDDLLPYFKKSETLNADGDEEYHGTDGPLSVSRGTPSDFSKTLVEAGMEAGLELNMDFNGAQQEGIGYYHSTTKDGHRHSAAAAFIKPVLDRPNLTVETSAHVTKLTFDGDRATGAIYEQNGEEHEVEVDDTGEVILSAGAIQTPQLLMLSGIGPADHLEDHGIDVKRDLPGVGRNLQDHLRVPVVYESTEPVESAPEPVEVEGGEERGTRYDTVMVGAFERSDPSLPAPDLQYGLSPGSEADPQAGFSIMVLPLRPVASGRVKLQSDDPYDDPELDPKYMVDEKDVDDFVRGIRRARRIGETDVLSEYREKEVKPGEDVQSDEGIAEYIRNNAVSGYHPTCTCKMGTDEQAVVDDDLRLHGIDGLRVVDASVMPKVTSGNTNAPTIAIAEKGADLIKDA